MIDENTDLENIVCVSGLPFGLKEKFEDKKMDEEEYKNLFSSATRIPLYSKDKVIGS